MKKANVESEIQLNAVCPYCKKDQKVLSTQDFSKCIYCGEEFYYLRPNEKVDSS